MPALTAFLLVSCSGLKDEEKTIEEHKKDYDDYSEFTIQWSSLFDMKEDFYHVYFFNKTCGHCNRIKDDIFTLADYAKPEFYFCEYNEGIPIKSCVTETIGVSSIDGAFICGTPSLITINKKKIEKNLCGEKAITSYIYEYLKSN